MSLTQAIARELGCVAMRWGWAAKGLDFVSLPGSEEEGCYLQRRQV